MRRFDRPFGLTAATLSVAYLCGCSGHQSVSSSPAINGYLPPAPVAQNDQRSSNATTAKTGPAKSPSLRVIDLDGGAQASGIQSRVLPVVNGSRLRIALSGESVKSATVEAGDTSAALEPAGEGQWTAVVRFVDSSNPPVQNPLLEVKMQTSAGERTFRIPILELHQ